MRENANPRRLLRIDEAAARIDQHRSTLYRKVATGELPAVRLGSGRAALRVDEHELDRWLKNRATSPTPTEDA